MESMQASFKRRWYYRLAMPLMAAFEILEDFDWQQFVKRVATINKP
jgi:hypothetical protein